MNKGRIRSNVFFGSPGKTGFPGCSGLFSGFCRAGGDGAFGLFRSGKTICRFFRHVALWAVFRRFQLVFIDDFKRIYQEKQKNYSIKLLFEIIDKVIGVLNREKEKELLEIKGPSKTRKITIE